MTSLHTCTSKACTDLAPTMAYNITLSGLQQLRNSATGKQRSVSHFLFISCKINKI